MKKETTNNQTIDAAAATEGMVNNDAKNILRKNESKVDEKRQEQIAADSIAKKKPAQKKALADENAKEEPIWRNWLLSVQAGPNMFAHLNTRSPFESSLTSGQTKLGTSYSYGVLVNVPVGEKTLFRFGYKRARLKSFTDRAISVINENGQPGILTSNAIKRNGKPVGPPFYRA